MCKTRRGERDTVKKKQKRERQEWRCKKVQSWRGVEAGAGGKGEEPEILEEINTGCGARALNGWKAKHLTPCKPSFLPAETLGVEPAETLQCERPLSVDGPGDDGIDPTALEPQPLEHSSIQWESRQISTFSCRRSVRLGILFPFRA